MNYRELLEFTKKHPNPFWNREEHEKEAEFRYRCWVIQKNHVYEARKEENDQQKI